MDDQLCQVETKERNALTAMMRGGYSSNKPLLFQLMLFFKGKWGLLMAYIISV